MADLILVCAAVRKDEMPPDERLLMPPWRVRLEFCRESIRRRKVTPAIVCGQVEGVRWDTIMC